MSDYLPDDDVLHVTTINRNAPTKSYVNIISYEGDFVPFTTTEADTLTQFFTDYNNIRTGVKSYIIDKQYQELVHRDNYVKKLCDMQTVAAAIEHCNYEYGPATLMFLNCHGSKRTSNHPAFLKFGEERHVDDGQTRYVWAGSNDEDSPEDAVFLSQLIDESGVVFLMCCNGDQIVEDYVSEMSECMQLHKIPDILFFNHENVIVSSPSIFMTLFMNLIDSDSRIRRDPYPNELYMAAKDAIITILQIVKCCNKDINKFWNFLLDMGCIFTYESDKRKQGLPIPARHLGATKLQYRLHGHEYHEYILEQQKEDIFNDFKTLTLISPGKKQPVYQNYESVDPLPSDSLPRVWDVLHNYTKRARELSDEALGSVKQQQSIGIRVAQQCINNIYLVNTTH
jgi:hypothetical protein